MLTENDGAKDPATLAAEADAGAQELSVWDPAGASPQAVRTAPSVSSVVIAGGAAGSKLISFPASPATNSGLLPAASDCLGVHYVFLNAQTPQQLGQQAPLDNSLRELGQSKTPWFIPLAANLWSWATSLEGPHSKHFSVPKAP